MLTNVDDMKTYLRLVESNATVKMYYKELRFKGTDVSAHLRFINYYRAYIEMSAEISELAKKKRGCTLLERTRIRMEMRQVRAGYRDRLRKLKAEQ